MQPAISKTDAVGSDTSHNRRSIRPLETPPGTAYHCATR